MLVVPVKGDVIRTVGGVKYTVLSYAAYKNQPAVYVDAQGVEVESIPFADIKSINGTPVALTPGKVFRANSLVKRKTHLPQQGDKVIFGGKSFKVLDLKLRDSSKLTDGLLVIGKDEESGKTEKIRLISITDIRRADDTSSISRVNFTTTYKDYSGR